MAESIASPTTTNAGTPTDASFVNLDDHQERRILVPPHQSPSIFTTNPNPTRIPCLQPLQLIGINLQTASKLFAAIMTVQGLVLSAIGIAVVVVQLRKKPHLMKAHGSEKHLLELNEASLYIGAMFATRGLIYTFMSMFMGIAASRAYICACRCWVFSHGILISASWLVTILGLVQYSPLVRHKVILVIAMLPCLLEIYVLYVVWSFTKELAAAAFAYRKIQNDAHGRFPSGSETTDILPVGLEMNASSQSYQLNVKESRKPGGPREISLPSSGASGSSAPGNKAAGGGGLSTVKQVSNKIGDSQEQIRSGGSKELIEGVVVGGSHQKTGDGETVMRSSEDADAAAARERRKQKLSPRSLRRSRTRV